MITLFNREELYSTYSITMQREIAHALIDAGIDYRIKVVNRVSRASLRPGYAPDASDSYNHIFYVHQDDLCAAQEAIEPILRENR